MANPQQKRQELEPPYRPDLVRALHSAVLYDHGVYPRVRHTLHSDDLYPSDRALWEAYEAITERGDTPDEFSVIDWLERHGRLGEVNGGALAIQQLSTAVSPDYDHMCEQWAREILDDSRRRTQIAHSQVEALVGYYPDVAAHRAAMGREQRRLDDIQLRMRGEGSATPVYEPLGVSMADVKVETFDWLWRGRIAFGKITMADGDPGLGKSLTMIDLVARGVMGYAMPDGSPGLGMPASAVIVCGEDGLADTVAPRLLAAGVSLEEMGRIRAINLVPEQHADGTTSERLISLVDDLSKIEATIQYLGARLLIVDPITAYLGNGTDMYKDSDLRRVLTPLALMAERTGVAVVAVRHLNKSTSAPALHRGLGGVGFIGIARLGLLFAPNPDTDGEVLVSRHKGNIGAPPPTMAYRIVQDGEAESMPRISWQDGERLMTAGEALAAQTGADRETRSATDEAVEWLLAYLADGPRPAKEVQAAARADGISEKTLRTARLRTCRKPDKEGMRGGWQWELNPEKMPSLDERASSTDNGGASPDFKPTLPKMPTPEDNGHLRTETPPKMPTTSRNGHLREDAVEFSNGDTTVDDTPPKMPTTNQMGAFLHDDDACVITGGAHVYYLERTADGRPVCYHCGKSAASIGSCA